MPLRHPPRHPRQPAWWGHAVWMQARAQAWIGRTLAYTHRRHRRDQGNGGDLGNRYEHFTLPIGRTNRLKTPLRINRQVVFLDRFPSLALVIACVPEDAEVHKVRTNIEIDDKLMKDALKATGAKSKREAVELGLKTLVQLRAQGKARELKGKITWEGDLNAMRTDR